MLNSVHWLTNYMIYIMCLLMVEDETSTYINSLHEGEHFNHLQPTGARRKPSHSIYLVVSIVMGVPKNGWFIMEKPTKMDDDWGYTYFRKPPFVQVDISQAGRPTVNLGIHIAVENFRIAVWVWKFTRVAADFCRIRAFVIELRHESTNWAL